MTQITSIRNEIGTIIADINKIIKDSTKNSEQQLARWLGSRYSIIRALGLNVQLWLSVQTRESSRWRHQHVVKAKHSGGRVRQGDELVIEALSLCLYTNKTPIT